MTDPKTHPSDRRILALCDGALPSDDADEVRLHCASCARCDRVLREIASVGEALAREPSPELLRPMWPVVRDRLESAEGRRFRPAFGLATAAAVAAGLFLGVVVGRPSERSTEDPGAYVWSFTGSSLAEGDTGTLSGAWTRMPLESGEGSR